MNELFKCLNAFGMVLVGLVPLYSWVERKACLSLVRLLICFGWLILDRVIDAPVNQDVLTWNGV